MDDYERDNCERDHFEYDDFDWDNFDGDKFVWEIIAMFWSDEVRALVQALPEEERHFLFVLLRSFLYEASEEARDEGFGVEARGECHIFLYVSVDLLLGDEWDEEEWSAEMLALEEYLHQEARFLCMMREA